MKLEKLGWIIAAGLAGAMAMSGFQGQSMKFASCDVGKVFTGSNLYKQNSDELDLYRANRMNVLRFLDSNSEMSPDDAKTYATLSLGKTMTDADKTKLEKIKADATIQVQKHRELATKQTKDITADDQATMTAMSQTIQANRALEQSLSGQYSKEFETENTRLTNEALEKVRKTIRDLAAKDGYNIVFSIDAAPYAANNITEEVLKDVNKS